jgi:putative signal transducing protein
MIPTDMSRAVPIGSFATRTEAEIVVGLLEAEGIPSSISADDAGGAYPFEFSGRAVVLVDESDAEAASQLLADRGGTA